MTCNDYGVSVSNYKSNIGNDTGGIQLRNNKDDIDIKDEKVSGMTRTFFDNPPIFSKQHN